MMNFILFGLVRSAVSILIQPERIPDYTITSYGSKLSIFSSFAQNPFLSLPVSSSQTIKGLESISIVVPPPIETYLLELSGFFKAPVSDFYTFSIGDTQLGILQIGSSEGHYQNFHDLFGEERHVFGDSPVTFYLEKDTYYPLKISYISGLEIVPIYLTTRGESTILNSQIAHIVKEGDIVNSGAPVYFGSGFDFLIFLATNASDYASMIENRSGLYLIHGGSFDAEFKGLKHSEVEVTNLKEITGYFQVPNDGDYNVLLLKGSISCFQFGPGTLNKTETHIINSTWNILDTRLMSSDEFSFLADLHYPFRLAISGIEDDVLWQSRVLVTDSSENEIDIFDPSTIESQSESSLSIATSPFITIEPEKGIEINVTGFKEANSPSVISIHESGSDRYSNEAIRILSIMDRNSSLSEEIGSSLSRVETYSGPFERLIELVFSAAAFASETEKSSSNTVSQISPSSLSSTVLESISSSVLKSKEVRETNFSHGISSSLGEVF